MNELTVGVVVGGAGDIVGADGIFRDAQHGPASLAVVEGLA